MTKTQTLNEILKDKTTEDIAALWCWADNCEEADVEKAVETLAPELHSHFDCLEDEDGNEVDFEDLDAVYEALTPSDVDYLREQALFEELVGDAVEQWLGDDAFNHDVTELVRPFDTTTDLKEACAEAMRAVGYTGAFDENTMHGIPTTITISTYSV